VVGRAFGDHVRKGAGTDYERLMFWKSIIEGGSAMAREHISRLSTPHTLCANLVKESRKGGWGPAPLKSKVGPRWVGAYLKVSHYKSQT